MLWKVPIVVERFTRHTRRRLARVSRCHIMGFVQLAHELILQCFYIC